MENSNFRFLLLFYHLPRKLVEQRPAYLEIPRKIREVLSSEKWMAMINSDVFLELVWDCYAWVAWQFFVVPNPKGGYMEIPGTWDHYSGDFPLWRYSYAVPALILKRLEASPRHSLQALFLMGEDYEMPWADYESFYFSVGKMTREIVMEQNWQPAFDEVWRSRQPEDYNGSNSKQHDFSRSWYHTRTPEKQVSLENTIHEGTKIDNKMIYDFEDSSLSLAEKTEGEDFVDHFKDTLTERDKRILELRLQGLPLAQIAKEVGYSNAGAVSKRIQQIAGRFEDFQAQSTQE